jgi:hypothetical protein
MGGSFSAVSPATSSWRNLAEGESTTQGLAYESEAAEDGDTLQAVEVEIPMPHARIAAPQKDGSRGHASRVRLHSGLRGGI